jgi:hypothetical protein
MSERSPGFARPLDERSWLTQHGPAELLLEQLGADGWQDSEDAAGVEEAGSDQGVVDVRVSSGTRNRRLWTSGWKGAAQHFRDNEPLRAVRYRGQDLLRDPLAVVQHPFLVAGRAEAVGLAGEG